MQVYRQGDVCFIPREDFKDETGLKKVGERPGQKDDDGPKLKVMKTRTIRRGENGGIHAIAPETKDTVMYEMEGTRYIISKDGVGIVHGEHNRVDLPPGSYEVRIQREASERSWRYVRD